MNLEFFQQKQPVNIQDMGPWFSMPLSYFIRFIPRVAPPDKLLNMDSLKTRLAECAGEQR